MPTSLYMPDVQVEIAFNSGYSTPAASRTWTDVSTYAELAEGIDIGFGRGDEVSTADANSLRLTLDNSDGRFTAARTASPYYPNVKIGRPIRVTATPVGGSASVRFVGYIDEWPIEWDGTDAYAKAAITARSRLARLGQSTSLKSIVEEEILDTGPEAYYTMGEPSGATQANDSSGGGRSPFTQAGAGAAVTFGTATGPGTDGLTAASFAGGKYLKMPQAFTAEAFECFFSISAAPASPVGLLFTGRPDSANAVTIGTDGQLHNVIGSGSSPSVADGAVHHLAWTGLSSGTIFLDGVSVITGAGGPGSVGGSVDWVVGAAPGWADAFTGTVSHVAIYATPTPADGEWVVHTDVGLTGFAGDTPAARLARYASYADIATAEQSLDTGVDTIAHFDITGSTALDAMRKVEATEGGVLFDGRDNTLTFHDRDRRYDAAAGLTLSMTTQQVEADYQSKLDRSALVNIADAQNIDGTITARVENVTSRDEYGVHSTSLEVASTNIEAPLQAASWRVNKYSTPSARVPSLSVNLLPFAPADQASILAATIGTRIDVTGHPSQAANGTESYFMEGYTESIGPESYTLTFNVSPGAVYLNVWQLDSSTKSQLDSTTVLAW